MMRQTARACASAVGLVVVVGLFALPRVSAQASPPDEVTFTRHIAPILQRSCQACHRPNSLAPMSLLTYEDARPYARAIKMRTALRSKQGVMPPWFIEKNIGIQKFKEDISLSDAEIAMIARWADNGAPRGNPADMPSARVFNDEGWQIGTPDLVVESPAVEMKPVSPDWWGAIPDFPTGLKEDRYVAAIEIKEVNDSRNKPGRATVGGLFIFHHAQMAVNGPDGRSNGFGGWPVHEVGRNADVYGEGVGKLLQAGSTINFPTIHLHSNGKDTSARLQIGFKFHPVGFKPTFQMRALQVGTGDLDLPGSTAGITKNAYTTLTQPVKLMVYEPHMHASGVRMCLDAIYGSQTETLNCSGYDHSWVKTYAYAEDAAPLLPKGTILKLTGYFDNAPSNRNVVDPRNWSGLGHRSIDNMLLMLGQAIYLTDEQFAQEVANRRAKLQLTEGQSAPGCPLCAYAQMPAPRPANAGGGQ